jgi:hypothetical protein
MTQTPTSTVFTYRAYNDSSVLTKPQFGPQTAANGPAVKLKDIEGFCVGQTDRHTVKLIVVFLNCFGEATAKLGV